MSTKPLTHHTPPSRRAVQANALWWFLCVVFPIASVVLNNTNPHPYLKLGSLLLCMGCFAWALGLVVKDFMRYTIVISEQEKIEKHTPEGMSPFSIRIICQKSGEDGWTGMYAPSDLFDTGLPQAERSLRIASFVALEVQGAANQCQDTSEDIDEAASLFLYDLEPARTFECEERLAVLKIRPLGQDSYTILPWPAQYSLQELADRAQSELTRTELQKISQSVRTSEQASPSVKPKI